jgi:tetratricopeptide (TPR) repeat protein
MPGRRLPVGALVAAAMIAIGCVSGALVASASFDAAVQAFERGDYHGAVSELEREIGRRDSARARILLGWSHYRLGDVARAKPEFDRALGMNPNEPNAYYAHEGLGWIAYRAGDYDRALAAFAEALRIAPGYHNAHDGLGWSYLAKGDLVRAKTNFEAAVARVPDDTDARRGLAFVAYHQRDWKLAIERLRGVLRVNDSDTVARSALGWAHHFAGEQRVARGVFEDVARREPTWADPLLGLALVAERESKPADAKAALRAAIDKSAAYVATAELAAELRKAFSTRQDWTDLWRHLGWSLYHQRSFALAEREWRAMVDRQPNDPEASRGLGYTLYALKRYREAIPPLDRAVAANLPPVRERVEIPGIPGLHEIESDAMSTLAWSHYHAGDLKTALRLFREVTTRRPDWPDPWSGLGWTLAKSGDRDDAERAFRQSLAVRPGYPDAVSGLRTLGKRVP